jgi:hypothetical protein
VDASHQALWTAYVQLAKEACKHGHFLQAQRILKDALHDAEEYGDIDDGLIYSIHALAGTFCISRDFRRAESLYRQVLEWREKMLGEQHADVADSLDRVALMLRQQEQKNEADDLRIRAESIRCSLHKMTA